MMAGGAAEVDFVDDGVAGLFVGRLMVVLQQGGSAAIDAGAVAFFDHALLAGVGVAVTPGRVDRAANGVVDQHPDRRVR